jgi:hypothetical protein
VANYEFNAKTINVGEVIVYVGGTTSTTTLDANLLSMGDLIYDFTDVETFRFGHINLTFSDFNNDIRDEYSNIIDQIWYIYVGGTNYFSGFPLKTSAEFQDNFDGTDEFGKFSVTLGANLLDTSGSYSLTSYDTNYYSLSDVIEATITNNTGVSTFTYGTSLVWNANGEVVYLDKGSAGASDAFVVIPKDSLDDTSLDLNACLDYMGCKIAVWKGACYLWTWGGAGTSLTTTDIIGSLSYQPDYRKQHAFDSWKYTINFGKPSFATPNALAGTDFHARYEDQLIEGDDRFPVWESHDLGNWTVTLDPQSGFSNPNGVLQHKNTESKTNFYNSDYWCNFYIFDYTYNYVYTYMTLDTTDFNGAVSLATGDKIDVTLNLSFYTPDQTNNEYNQTLQMTFQMGSGNTKFIDIPQDVFQAPGYRPAAVTFQYEIDDYGDIIIGWDTEDVFNAGGGGSGNVAYDGVGTTTVTFGSHGLSDGDVVGCVASGASSAFIGTYIISNTTMNTFDLDRNPYTTDTNSYSFDFRTTYMQMNIANLNIGKVGSAYNSAELPNNEGNVRSLIPAPYSYEKGAAAVEDDMYNVELRYDMMGDRLGTFSDVYDDTEYEQIVLETDQSNLNPDDVINSTIYGNGYRINKYGFNFKKNTYKFVGDK